MPLDRLLKYWAYQLIWPEKVIKVKYQAFKQILEADRQAHLFIARLEEIYYKRLQVDCSQVDMVYQELSEAVGEMVSGLMELAPGKYDNLKDYYKKIDFYCKLLLTPMNWQPNGPYLFFAGSEGADENLLGGKGVNLDFLQTRLQLPVPDFFIITTNAFCHYLESHFMIPKIMACLGKIDISDPNSIEEQSAKILAMFREAAVPEAISSSIEDGMDKVFGARDSLTFSVRSSAIAEDRESSFAGQYETMLDVEPGRVVSAYREVIKSKYNPSPLYYRIKKGYCDLETPMAVIVQKMMDTVVAGSAYSIDPDRPDGDYLLIFAATGQGERVVSGTVNPEVIKIDKKTGKIRITQGEGRRQVLSLEHAEKLAEWLLILEKHTSSPVDMEWCLDKASGLRILQTRALTVSKFKEPQGHGLDFEGHKILSEEGVAASTGCGAGRVHKIFGHKDLTSTPPGAVLVATHAPADFVEVFERVSAMVTEHGSAASHCASVARELGIPFVCGVKDAMERFAQGQPITVDADNLRIFEGIVEECKRRNRAKPRSLVDEGPLFKKLEQLIKMVSQLSLLDIHSSRFKPEGCRSIHDVIRFVHECAMREMFFIGREGASGTRGARHLSSDLPLDFYVLDVGGGLKKGVSSQPEIGIDHITSKPMQAFWKGLSHPSVKWSDMEHFAWEDYDAVVLAGGMVDTKTEALSSYAVVAADYMNLNIRFGYHFVQIDALATHSPDNNYINFRFSGGGGRLEGRLLRADFISGVLSRLGFKTIQTGELVDARLKHASAQEILSLLVNVGRLVGATKLMDLYLTPDTDIDELIKDFLAGRSDFSRYGEDDFSHEK